MKAKTTSKLPAARRWLDRLVSAFRRHDPMRGFWESRFDELATFNAEASRGIQHTPEKRERMSAMQAEYNAKLENLPGVIVMR